ncbi:hypothetical protein DV515_00000622 [Chloebia gouldiae]|uniref:Uncharacterized protein n=1 Tax=Chloebia gouldiae TaxID=44316 RepID=A0A3L8SZC0_CHLGU|nr:hypothetical protein DV515_00000622 [Chloebia gouldiae]
MAATGWHMLLSTPELIEEIGNLAKRGLDFPPKGSWRAPGAPALPAYVRGLTHPRTQSLPPSLCDVG